MVNTKALPNYDAFELAETAEGVYAAIDRGTQTGSNAGIIDLGGITVVFDTFVNIDAARDLAQACRELTGRDAGYVVNSHSHADHIAGNCVFGSAVVLSSTDVQGQIALTKEELEKELETYPAAITELEAALAGNPSPEEAADIRNSLFFLRNLSKPGLTIRVPDMSFTGELELHGTKSSLRLISFTAAHSKGDVIAWLPDCGVCFMGDMLFKHMHPWLGRGVPEEFLVSLNRVLALEPKLYVPGHGPMAGRDDVLLMKQYIGEMLALVRTRKSRDGKDYSVSDLSPVFHDWDGLCFPWNIQFLTGRENQ